MSSTMCCYVLRQLELSESSQLRANQIILRLTYDNLDKNKFISLVGILCKREVLDPPR